MGALENDFRQQGVLLHYGSQIREYLDRNHPNGYVGRSVQIP